MGIFEVLSLSIVVSIIVAIISINLVSYVLHKYYKMRFDQIMSIVMKHDNMVERFVDLEEHYAEHMRKYH